MSLLLIQLSPRSTLLSQLAQNLTVPAQFSEQPPAFSQCAKRERVLGDADDGRGEGDHEREVLAQLVGRFACAERGEEDRDGLDEGLGLGVEIGLGEDRKRMMSE